MKYLSKEFATIVKQKGFKEDCDYLYWKGSDTLLINNNFFETEYLYSEECKEYEYVVSPDVESLVKWVFDECYKIKDFEKQIEYLESWYNLLIPEITNKDFSIKNVFVFGGLIEMIKEFFAKYKYDCNSYPCFVYHNHYNYEIVINENYDNIITGNNPKRMNRHEAIHCGILKCFELLKNIDNDNR